MTETKETIRQLRAERLVLIQENEGIVKVFNEWKAEVIKTIENRAEEAQGQADKNRERIIEIAGELDLLVGKLIDEEDPVSPNPSPGNGDQEINPEVEGSSTVVEKNNDLGIPDLDLTVP